VSGQRQADIGRGTTIAIDRPVLRMLALSCLRELLTCYIAGWQQMAVPVS